MQNFTEKTSKFIDLIAPLTFEPLKQVGDWFFKRISTFFEYNAQDRARIDQVVPTDSQEKPALYYVWSGGGDVETGNNIQKHSDAQKVKNLPAKSGNINANLDELEDLLQDDAQSAGIPEVHNLIKQHKEQQEEDPKAVKEIKASSQKNQVECSFLNDMEKLNIQLNAADVKDIRREFKKSHRYDANIARYRTHVKAKSKLVYDAEKDGDRTKFNEAVEELVHASAELYQAYTEQNTHTEKFEKLRFSALAKCFIDADVNKLEQKYREYICNQDNQAYGYNADGFKTYIESLQRSDAKNKVLHVNNYNPILEQSSALRPQSQLTQKQDLSKTIGITKDVRRHTLARAGSNIVRN